MRLACTTISMQFSELPLGHYATDIQSRLIIAQFLYSVSLDRLISDFYLTITSMSKCRTYLAAVVLALDDQHGVMISIVLAVMNSFYLRVSLVSYMDCQIWVNAQDEPSRFALQTTGNPKQSLVSSTPFCRRLKAS